MSASGKARVRSDLSASGSSMAISRDLPRLPHFVYHRRSRVTEPPKPPAPPPRRPPPPPSATGVVPPPAPAARRALPPPMSASQKEDLALQALGLLQEQVQARIVHYKGEMETNAELDAITAQVVAQLKAMQSAAGKEAAAERNEDQIEAKHAKTLATLLAKLCSSESQFTSRMLKPLGRRVAKLFFESELHEKTKGDRDKVIHHAEQGVYYVLSRYKNRLRAELEGFEFVDQEMKQGSLELLAKLERDLQVGFLSRRSPELNKVMTVYAAVVSEFLRDYLPPRLEAMAKNTIRSANTARRPNSIGYKVLADAFPDFRANWERVFMEQMINCCIKTRSQFERKSGNASA